MFAFTALRWRCMAAPRMLFNTVSWPKWHGGIISIRPLKRAGKSALAAFPCMALLSLVVVLFACRAGPMYRNDVVESASEWIAVMTGTVSSIILITSEASLSTNGYSRYGSR